MFGHPLYRIDARTGEVAARLGEPVPITERFTALGDYVTDLPIHVVHVSDLDLDPSGEMLASSSHDGTVKLWQPDSALPARSFGPGDKWFTDLALGRSRIVAGRQDGQVRSWDLSGAAGECIMDLHGPGPLMPLRLVNSVHYSAEKGLVASGSYDQQLVLSDPEDCELIARPPGHRGAITGVEFIKGGEFIVSSSWDGTVKLWAVTP